MITAAYYGGDMPQNAAVGDFVSRLVFGEGGGVGHHLSMAVHDGDELIAGTLYHNWHKDAGTIELTSGSTSRKWLTRPVIQAMFYLPFYLLDCQACVLRVRSDNARMIKISRAFGFTETVLPRLFGRDVDMHVFIMTDDMWRNHKVNRRG